jgi:uncharacterized protein (TIGR02246 family)
MRTRTLASVPLLLALPLVAQAPTGVRAAAEIEALLRDFLAGVSRGDAAVHRTFWADDLIYTGSSGRRIGKADILKDAEGAPAPKADAPTETYEPEDIRVQQYGDTAVLAFRLVARTKAKGKVTEQHYLNTGVFVRRDDRWQAVAWQATKTTAPKDVDHKPDGKR